jgi:hypothetical protein
MNLLEKMNAEEFKKLLEYKKQYPTLGEELVKALTEKEYVHQLTLNQAIDLSRIFGINYAIWLGPFYDAFKSQSEPEPTNITEL